MPGLRVNLSACLEDCEGGVALFSSGIYMTADVPMGDLDPWFVSGEGDSEDVFVNAFADFALGM